MCLSAHTKNINKWLNKDIQLHFIMKHFNMMMKFVRHSLHSGSTVQCNTMKSNVKKQRKRKLEIWANAQRDGRPAEYRWRPLFKATKFG